MQLKTTLLISALFLFGCATSNELKPISQIKPSVAQEGSLANQKLINDATAGLVQNTNISKDAKILKFVIQQPVGKVGERAWREMWIVEDKKFIMTFREVGLNAADFEVQQM